MNFKCFMVAKGEAHVSGRNRRRMQRETFGCDGQTGCRRRVSGTSASRRECLACGRLRADLTRKLRHRTRLHQRGAGCVTHKVMDECLLPKADLSLRWMNVDIYLTRRHLEK